MDIHLESVDSTQEWAKKNLSTFPPGALTTIIAEEQTAGKGQFKRHWLSPKGLGLYASFYFTLPLEHKDLSYLSQLLSDAAIEALSTLGFAVRHSPPNDLFIGPKKLGGILIEAIKQPSHWGIIAGIGINVNTPKRLLSSVGQPATSLLLESSETLAPEALIAPLKKALKARLSRDTYNSPEGAYKEPSQDQPLGKR